MSNRDVFGFDEVLKSFRKLENKYPNLSDAMLMAQGRAVTNKTKSRTPTGKTKKLRKSWRLKAVKLYRGGRVRVVRVQSEARHSHLVELGHEIVRGGKTRDSSGRRLNSIQRSMRGIRGGGRVAGKKMLDQSIREAQARFGSDAQRMLDSLIRGAGF